MGGAASRLGLGGGGYGSGGSGYNAGGGGGYGGGGGEFVGASTLPAPVGGADGGFAGASTLPADVGFAGASTLPAGVDAGFAGASTLPAPVDGGYSGGGGGGYGGAETLPAPAPGGDDCADCGALVRTTRKVQVPCTHNEYKTYKVKVPVTVTEKVPRKVNYVDYENRQKTVSYQVNVPQTRFREEQQPYTVKVPKSGTRMVNGTKKVPRTIYVDVTVQEEQPYCEEVEETRQRTVKIPYTVNVPETRYKQVMEKVPVNKCKTVFDDVQKQTWVDQEKTVCEQRTTMITKEIPVYTWKQNEPGPCTGPDCGQKPEPPKTYSEKVKTTYSAPARYDTNNDGILDESERR